MYNSMERKWLSIKTTTTLMHDNDRLMFKNIKLGLPYFWVVKRISGMTEEPEIAVSHSTPHAFQ